jgi:hypothetical protein
MAGRRLAIILPLLTLVIASLSTSALADAEPGPIHAEFAYAYLPNGALAVREVHGHVVASFTINGISGSAQGGDLVFTESPSSAHFRGVLAGMTVDVTWEALEHQPDNFPYGQSEGQVCRKHELVRQSTVSSVLGDGTGYFGKVFFPRPTPCLSR